MKIIMAFSFGGGLWFDRWEVDSAAAKPTCPVCGAYQFEPWNDMDICDVCDWCNDGVQEAEPDYCGGAHRMSLQEAREAYKTGKQIR